VKKFLFFSIAGLLLLFITGCGLKEIKPRAIDEKNDKCVQCHMSVVDDQFATQLTLENGKTYTFDDIGCMVKWTRENKAENVAAQFVRDYESKEWILLENATYVYDQEIKTPMAYNVISFSDEQKAKDFAARMDADVIASSKLYDHQWEVNNSMMMKIKEEMGSGAREHSHEEGAMDSTHNKDE